MTKKGEVKLFVWSWRSHEISYDWKSWCRLWGKAWCFQLEKGEETGRKHFQGIISLKTKRTKPECLSVMNKLPEYFEPVSTFNIKAGTEAFYVTKEDTRIDGPWSDKDRDDYIPRQYRNLVLRKWQQKIWDSCDEWEVRTINVLCDPKGCSGKTTIAELCEIHGRGYNIPPMNDEWELTRAVADLLISANDREPKALFFDITRAAKQDKLFGLYSAIERFKGGKVTDTRYHTRPWRFDSPVVWVFCNTPPHKGYVTAGRWKFWRFVDHEEVSKVDIEEVPDEDEDAMPEM